MRAFDYAGRASADVGALAPPRIDHRAEARGLVRRAHREFVVVELAEHHGAVAPQVRRDGRLVGRRELTEDPRARGRAGIFGAEQVFDAERDALERPALAF